jgi:hypothetical protein
MFNDWRRKILDKFGGTSTIDASIMVFGLHEFCVSTGYMVANSLKYMIEFHRTHVILILLIILINFSSETLLKLLGVSFVTASQLIND